MRTYLFPLLLLLLCGQLIGCAVTAPYGIYEDKRLTDTITDDKALATTIKSNLLGANFSEGWGTAVYAYYGNVFLVGEVPPNMQDKAVEIARKLKGTRSVTTHWFTPGTSDEMDFVLKTRLRTNLIGAKGVSNTRIDTEVNAGRVVLLGVLEDQNEIDKAVTAAADTKGVKGLDSYLMLPPSAQ